MQNVILPSLILVINGVTLNSSSKDQIQLHQARASYITKCVASCSTIAHIIHYAEEGYT